MKLRSGGMAPLLAAEAAESLANGLERICQDNTNSITKNKLA